ncbi:hypothetical protein AC1031_006026 [Aphanomyces cochlioides]|nr:hypothetical protein AC1031_006026 [Aphanomyces cochlioides]
MNVEDQQALKKARTGRPKKSDQTKEAARWSEQSIECLIELRYKVLAPRFDNVKSTQAKKDAYLIWATELSSRVGSPFDASQVQNKLNDLRRKWTSPTLKQTGNGGLVKSRPQYYDIMLDYWGSKPGLSRSALFSTDEAIQDENSGLSSGSSTESSEVEPTLADTPKTDPVNTSSFSNRRTTSIKRSKTNLTSQAEALMIGLEAVGSGLNKIGEAMTSTNNTEVGATQTNMTDVIEALDRQSAALHRQSNQLDQLIQLMIARNADK